MSSIDDAVVTRLSKKGKTYEILVDSDKALEFRKGIVIPVDEIVVVTEVFHDSRKGDRVSDEDLEDVFNTRDRLKAAEIILREGQIQLTTEQRRKMVEEKKKQIADTIFKQAVDPKTKIPHPISRIMNAMEEAHVNIDPFKPANEQVEVVIEKIRAIIPLSVEVIDVALKVPIQYAGKASSIIKSISKVKNEEWKADYWFALIEIPAGMQSTIYEKINSITSGTADIKILKEEK